MNFFGGPSSSCCDTFFGNIQPELESSGSAQESCSMTKPPRGAGLAFSLIDVFADQPLTGNPLAVVADAEELDEATMGRIAREFNQSETTFLLPPTRREAFVRLRSFTPTGVEVFGSGHNALGAWWWLADRGKLGDVAKGATLMQEIGGRVLPVEIVADGGRLAAMSVTQGAPEFLGIHGDQGALDAALGVRAEDLRIDGLQPQVVSTGAAHLLVPARRRSVVEGARPDAEQMATQLRAVAAQGCYLFSLDPLDRCATAHARFFNPTVDLGGSSDGQRRRSARCPAGSPWQGEERR